MLESEIKNGVRVRCVFPHLIFQGKIGTIKLISGGGGILGGLIYHVDYDNGQTASWMDASSHELYTASTSTISKTDSKTLSSAQEGACKVCTRKNDLGVKKCWNCECSNPC